MKKILYIIVFIFFWNNTLAQTCLHNDLSYTYNYQTTLYRMGGKDSEFNELTLTIKNKRSNQIQKITITSGWLLSHAFSKCDQVKSYITGINRNKQVVDNDFGDLIIADLNFDNREDFALKKDSGGNGGPMYNFYIQQKNGAFVLDSFLTNRMEFFPTHIKTKSNTLMTYVHANVYQYGEHTYKYNTITNKWKQIKHRLVSHS